MLLITTKVRYKLSSNYYQIYISKICSKGQTYYNLNKYDESIAALDRAILLNPNHKGYHDLKLNVLLKKSK